MAAFTIQRIPGTRDFYPDDMRLRNWLFGTMRSVAERYGYEEYDGPLLEPYDLFAAKSGDQLVADEMYTLTDRGGRRLGIRPEMTPTLARMVAQRQMALPKPIKWFSIPACWRYERPQKGRVREHWQWNVDVLGVPGVEAEAEIIAVFVSFLREVGLTEREFCVRVGHREWLAAALGRLGVPSERHLAVLRAIDRREKVPSDVFEQQLAEAGLDKRQVTGLIDLLDAADYGDSPPIRELMRLLDLYGLGAYCVFDPTIVRGLAYYTSTVYEIWDARRELRAIAGGGRYDDLTVALGGQRLPGAGMAMGDVVVSLLLEREGKLPATTRQLDVFVACYSAEETGDAIRVAQRLRESGLRVERSLTATSLSNQLRQAEVAGARFAVILAPDELSRNQVVLRDLGTGQQSVIAIGQIDVAVTKGKIRGIFPTPIEGRRSCFRTGGVGQ